MELPPMTGHMARVMRLFVFEGVVAGAY